MNLLMITGDRTLAAGKQGAFHNTLSELHKHFGRIDIIGPRVGQDRFNMSVFGNVHVHPSPWPLILQPLWIRRTAQRLSAERPYGVMTVHEYAPFYNYMGARGVGVPRVEEVMHVPGVPRASVLRERVYRWLTRVMIRRIARGARAVRVINAHQTPDFLAAAGVPRELLQVVPAFYIDVDTFKPSDAAKQYDVAFVGRMASNKGLDLFLEVMERTKLVGVAVGDGPLLERARSEAKSRGLKIHFAGFVDDAAAVADVLNRSRLLLMPSYNEGGPRVVLEAMVCGVPVVATPVGIVPDVLPPESVEEWDGAALADKVHNILSDAKLYARLRDGGRATAQRFERTAAIRAYADFLKKQATQQ